MSPLRQRVIAKRPSGMDEPADLTNVYAMRTALWMIQEAYYHRKK